MKGRLPLKTGRARGFRLLYLKYLYLLRKPPSRRKTPVSRAEAIKFDRYQEQFFYLYKNRIDSVEPVSYTHLDVYKRQGPDTPAR